MKRMVESPSSIHLLRRFEGGFGQVQGSLEKWEGRGTNMRNNIQNTRNEIYDTRNKIQDTRNKIQDILLIPPLTSIPSQQPPTLSATPAT